MMMGKPVLMSAVGQAGEYLVDGESGMPVLPGDENAFGTKPITVEDPPAGAVGTECATADPSEFSGSGAPLQQCLAAYDHQPLNGNNEMVKIIFLVAYPVEDASRRYRIQQFIPLLERGTVHRFRVRHHSFFALRSKGQL